LTDLRKSVGLLATRRIVLAKCGGSVSIGHSNGADYPQAGGRLNPDFKLKAGFCVRRMALN
jgi:hypothetical protein